MKIFHIGYYYFENSQSNVDIYFSFKVFSQFKMLRRLSLVIFKVLFYG